MCGDNGLQRWLYVGQEQELCVFILRWNAGLESFEDVEIGIVRLGFVEVVAYRAAPAEGLALGAFQAARVDPAS